MRRAALVAAATQKSENGELRIGILASLTSGFLQHVLRRFREAHPKLKIALRESSPQEILHSLAKGDLDISFVTGELEVSGLASKPLWTESIYVALPATHDLVRKDMVDWSDLRAEPFVVTSGGLGGEIQDHVIRMLSQPGFRPRIDIHDVSRDSLLPLVAWGLG